REIAMALTHAVERGVPVLHTRVAYGRPVHLARRIGGGAAVEPRACDLGARGDVEHEFPDRMRAGDRMRLRLFRADARKRIVEHRPMPQGADDRTLDVLGQLIDSGHFLFSRRARHYLIAWGPTPTPDALAPWRSGVSRTERHNGVLVRCVTSRAATPRCATGTHGVGASSRKSRNNSRFRVFRGFRGCR